jgi:hypothetical protein
MFLDDEKKLAELAAVLRERTGWPGEPVPGGDNVIGPRPWNPAVPPGDAAEWQALRTAYARYFAKPPAGITRTMATEFDIRHNRQGDLPGASHSGAAEFAGASRWGSSLNWSGAVLAAQEGRRFTSIAARWQVPVPELPPGASADTPPPGPANAYVCSSWIGLDGHRRGAPSLPQIGTVVGFHYRDGRATPFAHAFAQWWVLGEQFGEVQFKDFRLQPGQRVAAWLSMPKRNQVFFRIRNESDPSVPDAVAFWVPPRDALLVLDRKEERRPVAGIGACWVVERPTREGGNELYPAPDFGTFTFEECWAGSRPDGDGGLARAATRDLAAARYFRLVERRAAPQRTALLSVPDRAGPDSLTVRYRRGAMEALTPVA